MDSYHSLVDQAKYLIKTTDEFILNYNGPTLISQLVIACAYIRISGFVENGHKSLIADYVAQGTKRPVAEFAKKSVGDFTNVNAQKCINLWGRFSAEWATQLEGREEMAPEGKWKNAFDAIYRVRNSQAHGGNQTNSIASLKSHFESVQEYFEFVKNTFLV